MQLGAEGFDNTDSARHYSDARERLLAAAEDIVRAGKALLAKPKAASVSQKVESETLESIARFQPVESKPKWTVDQLFRGVERKNAKDLAKAERRALASGKEPFGLARLEQLLGEAPGSQAVRESSLRSGYYILHPEIQTLAEFAKYIRQMEVWNG